MKFTCSKEALDRQLQHISRIITARGTLPVLSNILIETDGEVVRISGTDLEMAMTTYLPAEVAQEGTFTVPAKVFQEFVHQNPDESITCSLESFELVCTSKKVTGRIAGIEADEFPALPKVEKGKRFLLPLVPFVESMRQVVIACAVDSSRPVLTGVYCVLAGEGATFAATDSFRLVERRLAILPTSEDLSLILPARTIQEIIRISGSVSVGDLEMEIGEQQALFRLGEVELYSRLITGAFPKYQAIVPKDFMAVADVTTSELVQALRLSSVFSTAGTANVMLEVTDSGEFLVSTYGSQRGSTRHTIYAVLRDGFQPLRAAFNARFLLDACNATGVPLLSLRFSGPTSPLVVATEEADYLQLVMPIRLDS